MNKLVNWIYKSIYYRIKIENKSNMQESKKEGIQKKKEKKNVYVGCQ